MKVLFLFLLCLASFQVVAQEPRQLDSFKPTEDFDNVHVLKIAEDDHQSSYIIWVKENVAEHYHASHTETIVVIEGKGLMTIDGKEIEIKKGDILTIPEGTKHSVVEVKSHKTLKVLSIQTPMFRGKDRIFTKKPV